jgi:hypothetical protein
MIRAILGSLANRFNFKVKNLYCHLYLRKGKVFIPTCGRVPRGPYRDIEPVAVVDVSDADGLRRAFRETIARGILSVGPYPRPNPPPVVLKHAGVKGWGTFARDALPWSIEKERGIFHIVGRQKTPNGWVEDPEQTVDFPLGTTLDQVLDRMIAILQEAARQ